MIADQVIRAGEAADRIVGPGRSKAAALALLNRFRRYGIIQAAGEDGDAFTYNVVDVAACAVMAAVADQLNIRSQQEMQVLYTHLREPGHGHIVNALMDIEYGGRPTLVVGIFYNPEKNMRCTGYGVDFATKKPMQRPPGFKLVSEARIDLAEVLHSFVGVE